MPNPSMTPDCRIKWKAFCCICFFLILSIHARCPGIVCAQPHSTLDEKNVLVLHAFETMAPVFTGTEAGLSRTLLAGGIPIQNQFYVPLDLRRNPGSAYRRLLVEQMRMMANHHTFEIIVTMYPEALDFVRQDCRDIFAGVPILAMYLPPDFQLPKTDRLVVGHSASLDVIGTFETALELVPKAKHVYVVSGAHQLDKMVAAQARNGLRKWEDRLAFRYLEGMPLEDMLAALSSAPPETIVLLLIHSQDIAGRSYMSTSLTRQLNQVSKAPIFGLLDAALGYGIVGGSLLNFERIGTRAGELALEILKGSRAPENIPSVLNVPSVPMFDWRQLARWNLSEADLPEGSIVINREFSLWDYKYYILGLLVLLLLQSFLILRLLGQIRLRRSVEASLRQKTEELDYFFNVSPDLLCIANTKGYFQRLNPAWERTLGCPREKLMAGQFFDYLHPDDVTSSQAAYSQLLSEGKIIHFKNRYHCTDGTYRWLEWTAVAAGEMVYAAARDITQRLRTESELLQRREELAHVARIATMGELTAALAHEINQPLAAVRSNAEAAQRFLSQAVPDMGEIRQILTDIIRDDRRAVDVVQKVRGLVRKEKPRHVLLDLNEAMQEVVTLVRGDSLLAGLSIAMELSPGLTPIRGDRTQLQQVALNLILNGAAAMRHSPRDQRKMVVRTAMQGRGTVKASVTDWGTGIDENNIKQLFEPFFTTKPAGLGVGLSISRSIITDHGGSLEAANNPTGGATFAFTLPAYQGDAP